jgi:U3 small nucleolar RNA-associated protein 23
MRHLYNQDPNSPVIDVAKTFERRRCGHHPNEYPKPLSTRNCLSSIVGATNKYRYIVASQDTAAFRNVPAVPLIYIRRSVMILEPMSSATASVRDEQERSKFRAGLKSRRAARATSLSANVDAQDAPVKKKIKARGAKGPKGPNPLSVKKTKKTE